MSLELDPAIVKQIRALAEVLDGARRFLQVLADRLSQAAAVSQAEDAGEPEEGPALLRSRLLCVVKDSLDPAIRDLQEMISAPPNSRQ